MDPWTVLSALLTIFGIKQSNLLAEESRESFDESQEAAREEAEQIQIPGFSLGGQTFDPSGGGSILNLDPAFDVGSTMLDFFRQNAPSAESLGTDVVGPAAGRIRDIFGDLEGLTGGLPDFTTEGLLEGVEFPESDLSDVLGARLSGIEATGASRQAQRQQQAARDAQRAGMGLEGFRGLSESVDFEESGRRALETSSAVGQTRAEEFAADVEKSRLQAGAATQAQQLNAAMAQFAKALEADIGLQGAGAEMGLIGPAFTEAVRNADLKQGLFGQELGLVGQRETDELQKIMQALQAAFSQAGLQSNIASILSNQSAVQGNVTAPLMPLSIPDLSGVNPFPDPYLEAMADAQGGSSFGLNLPNLFTGLGGGLLGLPTIV
jgi:hypothetical protein